jgi:hypothetical protein
MTRVDLARNRISPLLRVLTHEFNPSTPPAEPDWTITDPSQAPVMWPHQCRDCWGWVDDPRHLTPLPRGDNMSHEST